MAISTTDPSMNKTPASPDLPQADPVSEVMALADRCINVATFYGDGPKIASVRAALESKVRELEKDAARMEWLLHHVSGKELRRIGVEVPSGGLHWGRAAIDSARSVGEGAKSSPEHLSPTPRQEGSVDDVSGSRSDL